MKTISQPESGEDFLSGIWYKKTSLGIIELKVIRKTKVELFNDYGIYVLKKGLKYYYTFTAKNILVLKWKYIHLSSSDETGQLLQIQSLKYHPKNGRGYLELYVLIVKIGATVFTLLSLV